MRFIIKACTFAFGHVMNHEYGLRLYDINITINEFYSLKNALLPNPFLLFIMCDMISNVISCCTLEKHLANNLSFTYTIWLVVQFKTQ